MIPNRYIERLRNELPRKQLQLGVFGCIPALIIDHGRKRFAGFLRIEAFVG